MVDIPLGLFKIIQVGAILIVLLGATASAVIGNFITCGKSLNFVSEQCKGFYTTIGGSLFVPQVKINEGIKLLQPENLNTIPDSVKGIYMNSVRADIFFSVLMSFVHLFIIYRILIFFPAFDDFFIKVFVIILSIIVWLSLQGIYAMSVLHISFITPFTGVFNLITNLSTLFSISTQQAAKVGGEIVNPI